MSKKVNEMISTAEISNVYKKALTDAYEYSITDEKGYWKKSTEKIIEYLTFNSDQVPEEATSGIRFDKLVDPDSAWTDIDERILNLLLAEKDLDYQFFSWLEYKVKKRTADPLFDRVSQLIQKLGLCKDDWDLCMIVMEECPGILLDRKGSITDFGRAFLKFDFHKLWKHALATEEPEDILPELYSLLRNDNSDLFAELSNTMFSDIVEHADLQRALELIVKEEPKKALTLALKGGDSHVCKRIAYVALFYARKKNEEVEYFKNKFSDVYLEYGVDRYRDIDLILSEMGQAGLVLLRTIVNDNPSQMVSAMEEIGAQFSDKACDIYVKAFCEDWSQFQHVGSIRSQKAYLKGIFGVLGKYDYSEFLPQLWEAVTGIEGFDRKTAADLLSTTPALVKVYVADKIDNGSKEDKAFAKLVVNRINKSHVSKKISFTVPDEIKLNLDSFISSLGKDIFSHIDNTLKDRKSEITFQSIIGESAGDDYNYYFHAVHVGYDDDTFSIYYDEEEDYEEDNYQLGAPFHVISPWISQTFDLPELAGDSCIFDWFPRIATSVIDYCQIQGVVNGVELLRKAGYTMSDNLKIGASEHDYQNELTSVNLYKDSLQALSCESAVKAFAEICFNDEKHRAIFSS